MRLSGPLSTLLCTVGDTRGVFPLPLLTVGCVLPYSTQSKKTSRHVEAMSMYIYLFLFFCGFVKYVHWSAIMILRMVALALHDSIFAVTLATKHN